MLKPILTTTLTQQKDAIERLIEDSRPGTDYYFLLSVSAFIATLGLIEDSVIIVIGGMLVAPLLSPILSLGMSITVASRRSLGWIIPTLFKSALLVSAIALVVSFLFRDGNSQVLLLRLEPNLNLFLIAFAAGAGAAYAWVKPNLIAVIPGIAIAVSLLPPLAAAGIGMETLSKSLLADAATLFLINLGGIVLASVVVFLLFGFAPLQKETEKIILAEEKGAEVAGK